MRVNENETNFIDASERKFINKKITNVRSDHITITHDKLQNILSENLKYLGLREHLFTSFATCAALIITIMTTESSKLSPFWAEILDQTFVTVAMISGGWFLCNLYKYAKNRQKSEIHWLINEIKNGDADPGS